MSSRIVQWINEHSLAVISLLILVTAGLIVPLVWMQPTSSASQEPEGPVFEARDLLEKRFSSGTVRSVYLIEATNGNILDRAPLLEILQNVRALREDKEIGPKLHTFPHPARGFPVRGLTTIAEAVDGTLRMRGIDGLAGASETDVAASVTYLLDTFGPDAFGLSADTKRTDRWTSPALTLPVLANESAVDDPGEKAHFLGSSTGNRERFSRSVLNLLRGEQRQIRVWGIAIDIGLTSLEQGTAAGPFIGLTIFAVLVVVALTFRSYWAVSVVGFSLTALIIWLKGLSNLFGLKSDQILSTIVPIAMISFGIDFAFHAIGRYREEARRRGGDPRAAFRIALTGVLGALLVAMFSDAAAFLSNATSEIEAIVQFGVAAAIATVASFVMLGVFSPLALMRIEDRVLPVAPKPFVRFASLTGSLLASLGAMTAVKLTVFISPSLGIAAFGIYTVVFLLVPLLLSGKRTGKSPEPETPPTAGTVRLSFLGNLVVALARKRALVLPLAALLTASCAVLAATRLETRFDVKDFFSPSTDFVQGLEKFDPYVGDRGGEPASIYVEGPLTKPEGLEVLGEFVREVRALSTDRLAKDSRGQVLIECSLLDEKKPDALWESPEDRRQATYMTVRFPKSRVLGNVREARAELEPLTTRLEQRLTALDPTARVILTGRPIVRLAGIEAVTANFRRSLPIAVLLCFCVTVIFMRSFRYALASIIPILLVIAWLYASMVLLGSSLNVVTATLGAISIGIGIDFSVHFTMRFREEMEREPSWEKAMAVAGIGTGGALLASAFSSVVGFSILAFAPMPLFASYGLLTAVMIALASMASLLVLPSLLTLLGPAKAGRRD